MTIVAAIDGENGSSSVLSEAQTLAERFGEPLEVLLVYEADDHAYLVNQYLNERDTLSDDRAQELAEEVVADVAADAIDEYEPVGRVGDPAEEILDRAAAVDARYIVIGGRPRSPVGKALFGSVTQSVLLDADRPVVTVMVEP
ncbi:universal stress protein [Halostagnicola kamekurae]|uniref:Nucleotide-binding universal stress protein, UspA family n=1 Tax=Halostagnicola kamekurae TaxID=619731 RepID=A0A1I6TKV5_9EURY|nr:universal stress protein [Halostagnicola kamekurae]SFS89849.1 Nucleotide-binding universal stress protein, UspA family [Halostagnicola kamekurae]